MGNNDGHEGWHAGGEHEAQQLPLQLDSDEDGADHRTVGADGESCDCVGGHLQGSRTDNSCRNKPE